MDYITSKSRVLFYTSTSAMKRLEFMYVPTILYYISKDRPFGPSKVHMTNLYVHITIPMNTITLSHALLTIGGGFFT